MAGIHARFTGPVKNPSQARKVLHGELSVTSCGLRLKLNDGRKVLITLDDAEALQVLFSRHMAAKAYEEMVAMFGGRG